MPFSAGTFTYTTSGLPVVTGTTISSTVENTKNTETATGLTLCMLKDGSQTTTAVIPFATAISVDDTTDTTSGTTGSIHTDGGVGVAKDLYVETGISTGITPVDYIRNYFGGAFTSGGAATSAVGQWYISTITGANGDTTRIAGTVFDNRCTTQSNSETVTRAVQMEVKEPQITKGTDTVTNSANIYIPDVADEATNNYAIWVDAGDIRADGDILFGADGTVDIGKTGVRAANLWSDLINGADYGLENKWRMLESDTYGGYGAGVAFDFGTHFEEGKAFATKKVDNGKTRIDQGENGEDVTVKVYDRERVTGVQRKPVFAVTDDFIEYKGRKLTPEILDKLLALVN